MYVVVHYIDLIKGYFDKYVNYFIISKFLLL